MIEKRCGTCKTLKPVSEFYKNATKPDGLASYCKTCKKAYNDDHYKRTKDRWMESRAKAGAEAKNKCRQYVIDYLVAHSCVDCGENDLVVLDFDHLKDKTYSISKLIQSGSYVKLVAEIKKCEVRCANCHRRITAQRMGGNYKSKYLATVP